jgi:hypothetical protein
MKMKMTEKTIRTKNYLSLFLEGLMYEKDIP